MSKKKEITQSELNEISEKTGLDPDILKSWYKGLKNKFFFLFFKLFF